MQACFMAKAVLQKNKKHLIMMMPEMALRGRNADRQISEQLGYCTIIANQALLLHLKVK